MSHFPPEPRLYPNAQPDHGQFVFLGVSLLQRLAYRRLRVSGRARSNESVGVCSLPRPTLEL